VAERTWRDRAALEDHFRRYGRAVGANDLDHFHALALRTIERGRRFTFRRTGVERIGYYDVQTRRFVVVTGDDETILSFSRQSENHVRTLADSTYGR
jgi:hypothetical protein